MPLDSEIIVVSGLPRSRTSMMMQILESGGIPVLSDHIRGADVDNPRGYYEFEAVKKTKADPSWLADARGKAVKIVSLLLYDLPDTENFRVIFQRRDLDEVLDSQEKMLKRLGRSAVPREAMKRSFNLHLERLFEWLPEQRHLRVLEVSYNPNIYYIMARRKSPQSIDSRNERRVYVEQTALLRHPINRAALSIELMSIP